MEQLHDEVARVQKRHSTGRQKLLRQAIADAIARR
jgi:hypothetical protein